MSGDARTAGLTLVIGNKNYSSWGRGAPRGRDLPS